MAKIMPAEIFNPRLRDRSLERLVQIDRFEGIIVARENQYRIRRLALGLRLHQFERTINKRQRSPLAVLRLI